MTWSQGWQGGTNAVEYNIKPYKMEKSEKLWMQCIEKSHFTTPVLLDITLFSFLILSAKVIVGCCWRKINECELNIIIIIRCVNVSFKWEAICFGPPALTLSNSLSCGLMSTPKGLTVSALAFWQAAQLYWFDLIELLNKFRVRRNPILLPVLTLSTLEIGSVVT